MTAPGNAADGGGVPGGRHEGEGATRRPPGRAEISAMLNEHGISPSRSLGQNFVADPSLVEKVVRLARVGRGDRVVEIGAGLGSLTVALAGTGAQVLALEIDRRLDPILRGIVEPLGVRVLLGDAMSCDWADVLGPLDDGRDWVLVANLPYNIATPLVADLLAGVPSIARMVVMVQREVAERLVAGPGSRTYGAVSVRVAYFAEARIVGRVSRDVFVPRPNVESALVELVRRDVPAVPPEVASFAEIDALVRAGFSGRRKMLRRSLSEIVSKEAFAAAGVDSACRPEELGVVTWGKLAQCKRLIETQDALKQGPPPPPSGHRRS